MTEQQPFEPLGLPPQPHAPQPVPPELPEHREPFWNYKDLVVFFGLAVVSLFLSEGLVRVVQFLFHYHPKLTVITLLPAELIAYILMSTGLALLLRWQYRRPFWRSLAWTEIRIHPAIAVVAGLVTALGVSAIGGLIQTPIVRNPLTDLLENPTSLALVALFGVTLAPMFEELFFRGFLQPLVVRSLGVPLGVLVAAIPFGLLHYQEYGNSWRHVVLISLAGAAFGAMRQLANSTRASTLMHASYNALFFIALLAQRGQLRH